MERLKVTHPTGAYEILIGEGLLAQLPALAGINGRFAIVTDTNVGPLYAEAIPGAVGVVTVSAGEQHKTLETVRFIYDRLFEMALDRKSTLVALGGGVVGDMTGFVAATFLRGIDFVQCPTTLLSMVDASIGGKTGVDMPQGKNLVGAFKQPTAVLADLATLDTLPDVEFACGMAEVIKHGILNDAELFARLERPSAHPPLSRAELIRIAIEVKRDVVQEDPFEQGRRATLNLGHTFGHAIEKVSQFTVRHGEGVAMGLVAAANLAARLELCAPALQTQIEAALVAAQLPTRIPSNLAPTALYAAMQTDKKKAAGQIRFVLPYAIEDVRLVGDVSETAVLQTLMQLGAGGRSD